MEPRSSVAAVGADGRLTCWLSTQTPHQDRDGIAVGLGIESDRVRVVGPDVGGGFGAKGLCADDVLVAWLALTGGRTVRWTETRSENMVAIHGRGAVLDLTIGGTRAGEIRAYRLNILQDDGELLAIGAMTRHADVARDPSINGHCAVLAQTAALVGDRQVRHRGAIGGSLAHADANGDLGTVVLALDAELVVRGPKGERAIPASEFFRSWYETALGDRDVLTEIRVAKGSTGTYLKHTRRTHDWATVAVAAVRLDGRVRVGLTSMGPTPIRAEGVEEALVAGADAATAAQRAVEGTSPVSDAMASAEYREHLAVVLTRRALERL
jgi:carbon-monoxide dehydrogenase medium subunit